MVTTIPYLHETGSNNSILHKAPKLDSPLWMQFSNIATTHTFLWGRILHLCSRCNRHVLNPTDRTCLLLYARNYENRETNECTEKITLFIIA